MQTNLLWIFLGLLAVAVAQDCSPYGVRVQYGARLMDHNSTQKLVVSFNTPNSCGRSFLRLLTKLGFRDVPCQLVSATASTNMSFFAIHVQNCPISEEINFQETFYYNVYGWDDTGSDPKSGLLDWVELNVIDPSNYNDTVNTLVMADWGVIDTTSFTPINDSLRRLMLVKELHLMVVVGDIAYDLDSKNGSQYIDFMKMAEEFISKIPCVFVPGNHQNLSEDDKLLLSTTFNLYGVNTDLATGFRFGSTYLLLFDPYNFVYFKNQTINSLDALKKQLAVANATGLFTIPFSHYPLVCSGEAAFCQSRLQRMHPYFDAMLDSGVSLYIGAHTHDYQRTYPYFFNQTFRQIQSPYSSGQDYLISVVQGVAGSNTTLIEQLQALNNYTAAYTVNETGYGILSTNGKQVQYSHYSTLQGWMDSFVIKVVAGLEEGKSEEINEVPASSDFLKKNLMVVDQ